MKGGLIPIFTHEKNVPETMPISEIDRKQRDAPPTPHLLSETQDNLCTSYHNVYDILAS